MVGNSGRSKKKIIVFGLIAALVLWFWVGRYIGVKGKILKAIDNLESAVENEDFERFRNAFSPTYSDDYGLNYVFLQQIARNAFANFEDIDVDISNVNIEAKGGRAEVKLRIWGEATRASTMGEGKMPLREAFEQTDAVIEFERSGGDWLVIGSRNIAWTSSHIQ